MTAAAFPVIMVVLVMLVVMMIILGMELHFPFHGTGNFRQFFNQLIRMLRRQPQLLGGEYDDCLFHFRQGIELGFDLRRAVGAA